MTATQAEQPHLLAGVVAELSAGIGTLTQQIAQRMREDRELEAAVAPVSIPAVGFTVSSNAVVANTQATQLGPTDGFVWIVQRVSLFNLGTSDVVGVYRRTANSQNFLKDFSAAGSSPGPTWHPGGQGLILYADDYLVPAAISATVTATAFVLSGDAIQVRHDLLARYLF